jgi:hypothetical protein
MKVAENGSARSPSAASKIATASLLVMLAAISGSPAAAQSADARERCTGDVMRLCSEFVPDVDSIVACLKAKRAQLTPSCLNALSPPPPEPVASRALPKKNAQKASKAQKGQKTQQARRTISPAEASRSTRNPY